MPPCGGQQRESAANPAYALVKRGKRANAQGEWPAAHQVVGGVMAYQADDG